MKAKTLEKIKSPILRANNRIVRIDGQTYLVRSQKLGASILADAELIPQGGKPIDLFGKSAIARELRQTVESGLFS